MAVPPGPLLVADIRPPAEERGLSEAAIREAGDGDAASALANDVAVEAVGAEADGDSGRRIAPSDLPTCATMPECRRRVGAAHAAQVGVAVIAGNLDSKSAAYRSSEHRIL